MTVNNNTNLINQICMSSGLEGRELEALRARLSQLSEADLQKELSEGLSGTKKDEMVGLTIQQTAPNVTAGKKDVITYTEENGNEVSEIFDGDNLLERTVTSKDENGKTISVTTQYSNNKPEKQIKYLNGNTISTTTFTYHDATENSVAYITTETKNADNSKVITTALEAEFDGTIKSEDIVDRTTVSMDGTETAIYSSDGRLIEQKVTPDGKKVLTAYNGTDISAYDKGELYRLTQQVEHKGKVYYAEYDGQGNTKTVTQNGESPALIAQKFNVKENALRRLNPLRKNPHGKGKIDPLAQVGEEILVNGQYNADSAVMRKRKSKEENISKYSQQEYSRRAKGLYSTEIKPQSLTKNYNGNYWELAKDLLGANASQKEIDGLARDLQLLNGDNALTAGTEIRVPGKKASSQNVNTLTTYGFKPSEETHGFYEKFNKLSSNEQQNVLSTIKYLKSQNITDPTKIKTEVMKTLGINLFDSEKVIHMQGAARSPLEHKGFNTTTSVDAVSLETYVTDYLGLDLNSETGKQVYLRLNSLPQETLDNLSANDFAHKGHYAADPKNGKPLKAFAGKTFDEVADALSANGVGIRTQDEVQAILSSPVYKKQQEQIAFRQNAAENIALVYDQAIAEIRAYKDSQGWINVGYWREKLGNLIKNKWVDTSFEATIERLEREKQFAVSRVRSCANSEAAFRREFKSVTGEEYDEAKIKKFLEEASKEGNDWSGAYKDAYGSDIADWAKSRVKTVSTTDGIADIAAMLIGTEAIAGTTAFKGTVKGISTQTAKVLGEKGTQRVVAMAAGGLNLGSWTLLSGTVNNLTKEAPATAEDWKNLGYGTLSSVGFGMAGGLLNTTVVDKVIKGTSKLLDKPTVKAITAVEKGLEKGGTKSGTEIMTAYFMNAEPGLIAKTAGLATEVVGFTGYEIAVDLCKDFFTNGGFNEESMRKKLIELGKEPEEVKNLSGADLVASYLGNTAWGQVKMLGEVKGVANLMMMMKGGRAAQKIAFEENLKSCESLKDVKVRKVEINGHEVYEITYADGNRATASSVADVVGNLNFMMQLETVSKLAKAQKAEPSENIKAEPQSKSETPEPKSYDPNEKIELQNLLKSQGYNLNAYGIKEKILKNEEQTHLILEILKDKNYKKLKLDTDVLDKITPDNVEVFKKLASYKNFAKLKPNDRNHIIRTLLNLNPEMLSTLLDKGIVEPSNVLNVWRTLINVDENNIEYMRDFIENSQDLFISQLMMNAEEFGSHFRYINKKNAAFAKELRDSKLLLPDELYAASKLTGTDVEKFDISEKVELAKHINSFSPEVKAIFAKHGFSVDNISDILAGNRAAVSISKEQQSAFLKNILANNNPQGTRVLSEFDFSQFGKDGVPLKYSRQDFIKNVNEIVKDLSPADRTVVLGHFGLDANFDGLINNKPFNDNTVPEHVRNAAQRVLTEIENFTVKNETTVKDAEAKAVLDGLIQGLPEFTSVIGKRQHDTHDYSVDVHMLNVLQSVMKDPLYKTLSDQSKTILKMSVLLHDIGKATGVIDNGHYRTSSEYMYSILDKFKLSQEVKQRIIDTVDNHHWFEEYNTGKISAAEAAAKMRYADDLAIYKLMAKADLENVSETFHLSITGTKNQAEFEAYFNEKMKPVEYAVQVMHETAPLLMDTKIVNGQKFPTKRTTVNGEETDVKVLNFSELAEGESLEQYGFAPGVTRDNATFNVHMTSELEDTYNLLNSPRRLHQKHPAISSSMIRFSEGDSYNGYGFILDVDNANLVRASQENFASGTKKDLSNQYMHLYSPVGRSGYRDALIKEISERTGVTLTPSEYKILYERYLGGKKYASQIKSDIKIGDKIIKAEDLRAAVEKSTSEILKDTGTGINNELVSIDPQIRGLVARTKNGKLEECDPEFLEFAKKHNLPIVLIPVKNVETSKISETTEVKRTTKPFEELSLDLVDKYTRAASINQANYNPKRRKVLSDPKVQAQVSEYLDYLLENNPEIAEVNSKRGNIEVDMEEMYHKDYFLPDGTCISLVINSEGKEMKWNEAKQRYEINQFENPDINFWMRDINGEEHVLPANSKTNIAKARQILNYMTTLEAVEQKDIVSRQNEILAQRRAGAEVEPQGAKDVLPSEHPQVPREYVKSPFDLLVVEHISNSEANAILRQHGLSEQEIADLRNQVREPFNNIVEAMNILSRTHGDMSLSKMSVEEIKKAIIDVSKDEETIKFVKFYNEKNFKIFADKFNLKTEEEVGELFENMFFDASKREELEKHFAKAQEIAEITDIPLGEVISSLNYNDAERVAQLTPERLRAQMKIAETLGIDFRIWAADDIKNPEFITPEYLQDLKIQADGLKKLGISRDYGMWNDPVEVFADAKDIIATCEKAGLDFSWYETMSGDGISISGVRNLLKQKDLAKVKSFIDACSPECKEKFNNYIISYASDEVKLANIEGYTAILNAMAGLKSKRAADRRELCSPNDFIPELEEIGVTDFQGVAKLLRAFDEVGAFPSWNSIIRDFKIENGDYDNAVEFVNKLNELYKDKKGLFHYGYSAIDDYMTYSWKPNTDFKRAVERIDAVLKSDIANDPRAIKNISSLVNSENPQASELFELLNRHGFDDSVCRDILEDNKYNVDNVGRVIDIFLEHAAMANPLSEVPTETVLKALNYGNENHTNMYLLKHMIDYECYDFETAKEKIGWHYNFVLGVKPENKALITRLLTDKELNFQIDKVGSIARYTNSGNIDFVTRLCTDKELDFSSYQIEKIVQVARPDNIELLTRLCTDKELDFPKDKIEEVARCTKAENIDLLTRLCTDKALNFPPEHIAGIASAVRPNKIELATRLCTDKELNFPPELIADVLWAIEPENVDLITRLCTDKTLNFPPEHIADLTRDLHISEFSPEYIAQKMKDFLDAGLDKWLIKDICRNAKSFSIFNNDVINILKRIRDDGLNIRSIVDIMTSGTMPFNLVDKIDTLLILSKFSPEEKIIFKKQGIDFDGIISRLMIEIDRKHPTISTSKEGIQNFLKHIANNHGADEVIQNANFAQFGKEGIPLEYSREEFITNMDKIIQHYSNVKEVDISGIEIPELKLSEADISATKAKIEQLEQSCETEQVEVILEGEKLSGTRFLGTQGGSNTAYYTKIGDKLYYIKYPEESKLGQSVEEVIASRLYRAAGIDSPNMKYVYDENGKIIGMAGEYVPSMSETPLAKEQVTDGFAVDAWLANWDAPKNDNTQYRENGVIKVDVGGSLRYRARGELKEFNSVVNELTTLIEQNSQFNTMTKEELLSSLKHVTEISEEQIHKILQDSPLDDVSLINTLLRRKEYMTIFAEKLEGLDNAEFKNTLEMVNKARQLTLEEFSDADNVAQMLGYVRTKTGFEGLLNTQNLDNVSLTPEQREMAQKMTAEIEKFTKGNKVADGVNLPQEAKDFLNSILQGVPEFASFFGKPQHSTQDYSLDIHILKVLQDSMNDPMYKQLSDKDKIVLKFSTLLHDIGKRYLIEGSDTGHAEKSAEYVYSILDKFNLSPDIKDRIISVVENHHWFKAYNTGNISPQEIATLCRRPEDFLIYQIMAKADLKNVNRTFYERTLGASSPSEADAVFASKMAEIKPYVQQLAEKQVVITPTKFVQIPERVTPSGKVLAAREFPKETVQVGGVDTEFSVLNLSQMDENTDMFQYGFNQIPMKDLRLMVHMVDSKMNLEVFKTLAQNPMNNSAQSISMISMADKATYCNKGFGLVLDVENANISHAYYANTGSGSKKGFNNFIHEMFENGHHRSFVKDKFQSYMAEKGIELSDKEYAVMARYIMSKEYPETSIRGIKIGDKSFSKEDILGAFIYSRDELIEQKKEKTHGSHNEIVGLNSKVKGLVAKANSLAECPLWFLEFARDNNYPIILVGN